MVANKADLVDEDDKNNKYGKYAPPKINAGPDLNGKLLVQDPRNISSPRGRISPIK
jgi:hypothetical protein